VRDHLELGRYPSCRASCARHGRRWPKLSSPQPSVSLYITRLSLFALLRHYFAGGNHIGPRYKQSFEGDVRQRNKANHARLKALSMQ
jgi:hypothetical protein